MTSGTVVIVEATSQFGRALCVEICARGWNVVGLGRNSEELEKTAQLAGGLFMSLLCDVVDPDEVAAAFGKVRNQLGGVSVLVNGPIPLRRRDILDETAESLMTNVTTNLAAVVNCSREALADMVEQGRGRIFNIGAAQELTVGPASTAYAVSHEAVRSFSRFLASDVADRFPNIVVTNWASDALSSGPVRPGATSLEQAARWAVTLALSQEPALHGTNWVNDREIVARPSFRRHVTGWLYGDRPMRQRLLGIDPKAAPGSR